ncbi:protein of unknown function [Sterolibacterium denitrificans]|uniref:Uncharacterized protein n=1 Tax=Sterolibacterium denitrificans TaxID=157592 RepID=A0A7Z7HRN3_9PROT|nr:protein of unknown function [Sterolibacterium denitrificans]
MKNSLPGNCACRMPRSDGIPKRIEPYSYHIADAPERLADGFDTLTLPIV